MQLIAPGAAQDKAVKALGVLAGQKIEYGVTVYEILTHAKAEDRAVQINTVVELPERARLDQATFAIAASPGGTTAVASVAQIREATPVSDEGSACVVDFGRMVTVSGCSLPVLGAVSITQVLPWLGTRWGFGIEDSSFPELLTERLLVESDADASDLVDAMTEDGAVELPAQPTGLELLIDGTTVWFERQGSTPGVTPGNGAVVFGVDRTDALREALARARPQGGKRSVTVSLRASTPGNLVLTTSTSMLHEHPVVFGSDSRGHTIDATEEGTRSLDLSGPFAAADRVREVALTVRGSFGSERVEPVDGPGLVDDASLVLGAGRSVLFGIPRALADRFGELQALRLRLTSERGGELAGRLLTVTASGTPGPVAKGGDVPPVQVPAGQDGWFTIGPAEPIALPTDAPPAAPGEVALWLELVASYGEISCGLTESTGSAAPGAPILRRLPGGGTKPLSLLQDPAERVLRRTRAGVPAGPTTLSAGLLSAPRPPAALLGAIRVVGLAGRRELVPALSIRAGSAPTTIESDPTGQDVRIVLGLEAGIVPVGGMLPLHLRIAAPGTVSIDDVVVAYRKGS